MNAERDRANSLLDEICRRGRVIDDLLLEVAVQEELIEQLQAALAERNVVPLRRKRFTPPPPDAA